MQHACYMRYFSTRGGREGGGGREVGGGGQGEGGEGGREGGREERTTII